MNSRAILLIASALLCGPYAVAQDLGPQEALDRMEVHPGFEVQLFASEPEIRQPLSMTFDERGRMWVVQYLQYPTPAGLEAVEVDQYLRTKYDRLPEPPPHGPKGVDRITIAEDTDGDGRADLFKDFVSDLNLATGVEIGYGGVFVLQSPYLLYYADADRDDIPDGDPEVLLTGFGMEDAHAYANSLAWGPDGWLYGAQGSTVTANIRGLRFNQGIWRYHPLTREFEIFSEGGGNTWGLDFDAQGEVIAGTNWGGFAMLHQLQGAYHIKNFGKHGELQNPHAYGFFNHVPYEGFVGGHVTSGGIVYHGGAFPAEFEGQYVAANLLSNSVHWHPLEKKGASFTSRHGGELLLAHDPWFRPVDCALGPEGAVYVTDWHDKRATHVDPKDDWDRTNGRIFSIAPTSTEAPQKFDLHKNPTEELIELLGHPNHLFRRLARRVLTERRAVEAIDPLKEAFRGEGAVVPQLEAFWTLASLGGFDAETAKIALESENEAIRAWAIRFLGDSRIVTEEQAARLVEIARTDASATVRAWLACSAKRFSGDVALPIVWALLDRDEDAKDSFIPLLLWWALEDKAISDREAVLDRFSDAANWGPKIVRETILERIGRRYAAEGTDAGFTSCARLIENAPDDDSQARILKGVERGLQGQNIESVPTSLEGILDRLLASEKPPLSVVVFGVRLGSAAAKRLALDRALAESAKGSDRVALINTLGEVGASECVEPFLEALDRKGSAGFRETLLASLERFSDERIPARVLELYPDWPAKLKGRARRLLAGRKNWAASLLAQVETGTIEADEVDLPTLRRIRLHGDETLDARVEKHWGRVEQETGGLLKGRIRGVTSIVRLAEGDADRGKAVFEKVCAVCHKLFDEGKEIGPDLTGSDRGNRTWLIDNIVDPNLYVRPEYIAHNAETYDGRMLTGLIVESDPNAVTILNAENERTTLSRDEILDLRESSVSLMPVGLLDPLEPVEVQDLFAYLRMTSEGTE